jgi:two-component system LytT family sensor kinase
MPAEATPALLHIAGYLTGATLYAMLLVLLLRAPGGDRLARATALLGLIWNVGELLVHGTAAAGLRALTPWLAAIAYTALGLLAAVVVHSVSRVRDERESTHQRLAASVAVIAYIAGAIAGLLHLAAAATGDPLPSTDALDSMTLGLILLSVPLVIVTQRQPNGRRALWMTALAVFAVSALHLGRFHGANESWATELLGHHASIPLAFAMLYRDYRFALADLFLKRGLTLLSLVAIVLSIYTILAPALRDQRPAAVFLLLGAWVLTAWLFPTVRRVVHEFVDRAILSRANYATLNERVASSLRDADTEHAALTEVCANLMPALTARSISPLPVDNVRPADALTVVDIPTADAPRFQLAIGPLTGGRRLLSDDLVMLDQIALQTARRIDAIRMAAERYDRMLRERDMKALAVEAELRALRAQVNPHFLFNALTTIGHLIQEAPARARDTLMQLTTLLRAVLKSDGAFTSLGRERELVEAYLRIERARFEDRLTVVVDIPAHLHHIRVPALIVQPLVENAVKHGVAPARDGGRIAVVATLVTSADGPMLRVRVTNTGTTLGAVRSADGVGIQNVSRRLEHYYQGAAAFSLYRTDDGATIAELTLPADVASEVDVHAPTGSDQ